MNSPKNLTIYRKNPLYPLNAKALVMGQIYEGSDRNLYVAAGNLVMENDHLLLAIGLDCEIYVDDSPGGDPITFRECKVVVSVE